MKTILFVFGTRPEAIKMAPILSSISKGKQSFISLCADVKQRVIVVITFLAVLEMIKEKQIRLYLGDSPMEFYIDLMPVSEILGQD